MVSCREPGESFPSPGEKLIAKPLGRDPNQDPREKTYVNTRGSYDDPAIQIASVYILLGDPSSPRVQKHPDRVGDHPGDIPRTLFGDLTETLLLNPQIKIWPKHENPVSSNVNLPL